MCSASRGALSHPCPISSNDCLVCCFPWRQWICTKNTKAPSASSSLEPVGRWRPHCMWRLSYMLASHSYATSYMAYFCVCFRVASECMSPRNVWISEMQRKCNFNLLVFVCLFCFYLSSFFSLVFLGMKLQCKVWPNETTEWRGPIG